MAAKESNLKWPNKEVPVGVIPTRKPTEISPPKQEPRPPPCRDLLDVERRWRVERSKTGNVPAEPPSMPAPKSPNPHVSPHDVPYQSNLTLVVYKYTRGYDTVNDEMGYGEQIREELWHPLDGGLDPQVRTSQRTKTGRQVLEERKRPGTG